MNDQTNTEFDNETDLPSDEPDSADVTGDPVEAAPVEPPTTGDGEHTDDDSPADDAEPLPDIDAALASVAALPDVIAEQEAAERAEQERIEAEQRAVAAAQQAAEEEAARRASHYYPHPPRVTVERGQLASVAAAISLIGVGAWLTLTLTTTGEMPEPGLLGLVLGGVLGVMMLAYWLTSERWGRGSLFGGLTLLLSGGLVFFVLQADGLGVDGWPLLIVAPGVALLLTALLSQPFSGRLLFAGVILALAGIAGLVVTTATIAPDLRDTAQAAWPFVLGIAMILLFLPAVLTRK